MVHDPLLCRILGLLTSSLVPLAEAAGAGLVWREQDAGEWVGGHITSRELFVTEGKNVKALFEPVTLLRDGRRSGDFLLLSARDDNPLLPALQRLLQLIVRQVDLESQEQLWLEELSESWESLDALYEMTSDFRFFQEPELLLGRILNRAVSRSKGLRARLWIEDQGILKPVGEEEPASVEPRDPATGWIGKALSRGSLVLNEPGQIGSIEDLEPELREAQRLVIVSVTTGHQTMGALEVWDNGKESPHFTSSLVRQIEALALLAAMAVETERSYRASLESERLQSEVAIAARIQQLLLSAVPPDKPQYLRVGILTEPSRQVDGDFFDFVEYGNGSVDIFVGDVMGKGVPAALLGAATKTNLLRSALRLMSGRTDPSSPPSPELIVSEAHVRLFRNLLSLDTFVTLAYLRVDPQSGACGLVDCGHLPLIHWDSRSQEVQLRRGDNLPLGIDAGDVYKQFSFVVSPGDTVVLYSDGLTEARASNGVMFGEARLTNAVRRFHALPPDALLRALREEVARFSEGSDPSDDLTCLAIRFGPAPSGDETEAVFWSTLDSLAEFRGWLKSACGQWSLPEDFISALELVGTEVLSNIIRHAYGGRQGFPVLLNAQRDPENGIWMEFTHWGEPYDGPAKPPPSFDENSEGGFGLYIVSQLIDKIRYERLENGASRVQLYKALSS